MKKFYILIIIFVLIFGVFVFVPSINFKVEDDYSYDDFLRIHIRANSNSKQDQNVKYKVKEALVELLTPLLADADTKQKAECIILNNMSMLDLVADDVLEQNGFSYKAKTSLRKENFPTRSYDELTLKAGSYDAVIVELGSALGDNWWCVVYPPMCFVDGNDNQKNVVFKSKIYEIIRNFFKKE